jgi:thiamine-phosphate pyrophosphorylase
MHNSLPKIFVFLKEYNPEIFKHNITNLGIIYRNYNKTKKKYDLSKLLKICKRKRYKLFISNNIKLAVKIRADGIYIPSFNKNFSNTRNLGNKNLIVLGSAHNYKEINIKLKQKCSAIFISPVFPVSKRKNYLGIHKFNFLSQTTKSRILALGGINEDNFLKLKMLKIAGFGGISIFKKKTGLKKAGSFKE